MNFKGGTSGDDEVKAVVMYSDGSSVLAGYTTGNWNTTNFGGYDFVAVKLDINGSILWKWQDGTGKDDYIEAAVGVDDGSVIIAGYTYGSYGAVNVGFSDFLAVKIDSNGNTVWKWQDGSNENDTVQALAVSVNDSVVLVGHTTGNWNTTNAGYYDCAAIKLDANGTMMWAWQNGTEGDDQCEGVAITDDDSIIVAGKTYGNWGTINVGDFDFVAVKLDAAGEHDWVWQNGTIEFEDFKTALPTGDGSTILAGVTFGSWNGNNTGSGDLSAVKLYANGSVDWKWQEGSSGWDVVRGAAALSGEGIVFAGHSHGNWSGKSSNGDDFAAVELDLDGVELWRWQNGTTNSDRCEATATDGERRVLLGGYTGGNWSGVNAGKKDFVAVLLERPTNVPSSIAPSPSISDSSNPSSLPQSSSPPRTVSPEAETRVPFSTESTGSSSPTSMVTVASTVAAVIAVIILVFVLWIWRRNTRREGEESHFRRSVQTTLNAPHANDGSSKGDLASGSGSVKPAHGDVISPENRARTDDGSPVFDKRTPPLNAPLDAAVESTKFGAPAGHGDTTKLTIADDEDHIIAPKKNLDEKTSTTDNSAPFKALDAGQDLNDPPERPAKLVTGSTDNRSNGSSSTNVGLSVAEAVMETASTVASSSSIPFVGETALLVSLLVKLVVDNSSNVATMDKRVRWCKSIVSLLKRASELLGKGDDGIIGDTERCLLEDVHDSVNSLVGVMQTYKAKDKMSKLFVSSLFKRRQEEAEAVINNAISSLQLGLQVQSGHDLASVGQHVQDIKTAMGKPQQLKQLPESQDLATQFAQEKVEARREKRQRRLLQLEIPEDQVTLTDIRLGKGGSGEVYLADFSGINAAAKVLQINTDPQQDCARHEDSAVAGGEKGLSRKAIQRTLFLRELQVMSRLRSPYTVHVYGAITSPKDRFVIVMELMPGGDLHTLLKEAKKRLPEIRERGIMRDICFGMAFLHSKGAIHGDLKSANVLFDSAGTAKIADFGTARWAQHSATTGLATTFTTTKSNSSIQMSIPWAAPEVLDDDIPTFKSDVYSFGIIAWEIVAGKMPWANLNARAIFKQVLAGKRPELPNDTAADVAEIIRSCWQDNPTRRPTFTDILDSVKSWPK